MHKHITLPAIVMLSVGLTACATPPNDTLEQARANYSSLENDPKSLKLAALETQEAEQMLDKADMAFRQGEDEEAVSQLAYVANQKVELAKHTIDLRTAEEKLDNMANLRARARLEARDAQIRSLQEAMAAEPTGPKIEATQTERGAVITFGDVFFDLNKAELRPSAVGKVQILAQFLKDNPERKVLIEGFTDSTGSDQYNLGLSQRRADGLKHALVRQGIDINRITTQGFGEEYAVTDNSTPAARAMNRRVEVTVSNDASAVTPRR